MSTPAPNAITSPSAREETEKRRAKIPPSTSEELARVPQKRASRISVAAVSETGSGQVDPVGWHLSTPTGRPHAIESWRYRRAMSEPGQNLAVPPGPGLPSGATIPAGELVERFSRSPGPG